jgi:hypothetical protein
MANKDMPSGFSPKGQVLRSNKYVAGSTVYPGDAVTLDATGRVSAATAGQALCGVSETYAVAGEDVIVSDHPDQLFAAQGDDASIAAQTDCGLNYDIVATAGDSSFKQSRMEIDASTKATTATLPIKVLGLEPSVGNAFGANARVICKINNHQLGQATGTAGV